MIAQTPLRVGVIDYLNVAPLYHKILNQDCFQFQFGIPTQINQMMRLGQIDAAAISSYEYAKHGEKYYILPDLSVSAEHHVGSIYLFSHQKLESLEGHILLTPASATSVHLLYYLLRNHCVSFSFSNSDHLDMQDSQNISAYLLIGDPAIQEYRKKHFSYAYDLANLWNQETSLPFVFALWCIRKDFVIKNRKLSLYLLDLLRKSKPKKTSCYNDLIKPYIPDTFSNVKEGTEYLTNLRYDFAEDLQQGFLLFQKYCYDMGKLDQIMSLEFLPT